MPICIACNQECDTGSSYIAVIEREGRFQFRCGCVHHPIEDAACYLGSEVCAEEWLHAHPNYVEAFATFLTMGIEC